MITGIMQKMKNSKYLSELFEPEARRQLIRYLVTGFSTAAFETLLLFVFKSVIGLSIVEANSIALAITFWLNFFMNRIWSFKSKGSLKKQLLMYGMLFAFNLGASDLIMHVLATLLGMQYIIAKFFAIGAIVCWNFVIYKKVIYK